MPAGADDPVSVPARLGITRRVLLLSLVLMPLNCYWVLQMEIVWYCGQPTTVSLYFHVIFTLLVMLMINAVLRRCAPRWALHPNEFLTLYIMLAVATSVSSHDQVEILVSMLGESTWFATPENRWAERFDRFLPDYLVMKDRSILKGFYEGESTLYTTERLLAWAVPAAIWIAFIVVLVFTCLCINVIVRKQWTDRERLSYPIAQIPLAIVDPRADLWRSRLFWLGFALAAGINVLNGLNYLYPSIPGIPTRGRPFNNIGRFFVTWPWNVWNGVNFNFYPFAIGLGYLLPVDLLFASWFFFWYWQAELVVAARYGWLGRPRAPYIIEQSFGAYMGLFIFALWIGRGNLAQVLRHTVSRRKVIDDSREPLGYRWAVVGAGAGFAALVAFSWYNGMPMWIAVAFFAISFALLTAVTRMRAELGPPAHDLHYGGPDEMMTAVMGTQAIGPGGLAMFSMFWWLTRAYRSHPMPHQLEGFKIAERRNMSMRPLFWAMMLAGVVGAVAGFWGMLHIGYRYGMGTANVGLAAHAFAREPWDRLNRWLEVPQPPNRASELAIVVGLLFSLFLLLMRTRFAWWPFHPVGYAVSSSWSMGLLWGPLLIAWLIKLLVLRWGGLRLYRRGLPLFLGMIIGECMAGAVWSLIGVAFQTKTYVFWPY